MDTNTPLAGLDTLDDAVAAATFPSWCDICITATMRRIST